LYDDDPALSDLTGTLNITNAVSQAFDATVSLYQGTTLINTYQVTTNTSGQFLITGILPGSYDFWVKNSKALAVLVPGTLIPGANAVNFGSMISGDFQNDNDIDITDFSGFANVFNINEGEPGYNPQADFNISGTVNITDFSLFANGYGNVGASIPSTSARIDDDSEKLLPMSDAAFEVKVITAAQQIDELVEIAIGAADIVKDQSFSQLHVLFNRNVLEVVDIVTNENIAEGISHSVDTVNGIITFTIEGNYSGADLEDMVHVIFRSIGSGQSNVTLITKENFSSKAVTTKTE
jgi:hypothetical protein